jgi:pseudaminic acid synthase
MQRIYVGTRAVGPGYPCFVIAEAGSNHDQKLSQAHKLVDIAADAGADAVKFQSFVAAKIAAPTTHPIAKIQFGGAASLYELYEKMQLPQEWQAELNNHAQERNISFLSTPFDEEAADELEDLGIPVFKIASFELVHLALLRHIARKKKPMILSTGMANLGEIEQAVNAIRGEGSSEIALLHCAINYPSKFENVNLSAMDTMAQAFQVPIGYSDHTPGITVPIAAVARGACILEKHFTLDRRLIGADHGFALEPAELKAMVTGIREAEAAIGSPVKQAAPDEIEHRARGRRSLFAKIDIPAGTIIASDMVSILRPGVGVAPSFLDMVVGRRAQKTILRNEPITWDKI